MKIERVALCLNVEDPDQKELHDFLTKLPNGKKRNGSAFLKTLLDREYQKKRDWYLSERSKFEQEKRAQEAPKGTLIKSNNGGIRYQVNSDLTD